MPTPQNQRPVSVEAESMPLVDITRRFVRILSRKDNGLIEFEFSIDSTDLMVELMLPLMAFDEFCEVNQVQLLPTVKQAYGDQE